MKRQAISKRIEAYQKLKEIILDRTLSPGQKLISRDLEDRLGMTKTPIINALTMLEQEGLVVSKKNRGFYVSDATAGEVETIFELRGKLEDIVIDYAIKNYQAKDLVALQECLKEYLNYRSPIYDAQKRSLDTAFHLQVANMTKLPYLIDIMKKFYTSLYFNFQVIHLSPLMEEFKKEHHELFEAIKTRNITDAKSILRKHNKVPRRLSSLSS